MRFIEMQLISYDEPTAQHENFIDSELKRQGKNKKVWKKKDKNGRPGMWGLVDPSILHKNTAYNFFKTKKIIEVDA